MPLSPEQWKKLQQNFNSGSNGFGNNPPPAAAPVTPPAPSGPSFSDIIKEKMLNPILGSADMNIAHMRGQGNPAPTPAPSSAAPQAAPAQPPMDQDKLLQLQALQKMQGN